MTEQNMLRTSLRHGVLFCTNNDLNVGNHHVAINECVTWESPKVQKHEFGISGYQSSMPLLAFDLQGMTCY